MNDTSVYFWGVIASAIILQCCVIYASYRVEERSDIVGYAHRIFFCFVCILPVLVVSAFWPIILLLCIGYFIEKVARARH